MKKQRKRLRFIVIFRLSLPLPPTLITWILFAKKYENRQLFITFARY